MAGGRRWESLVKGAQRAEELGYYAIGRNDHFFLRPDHVIARNVDTARPANLDCYTTLAGLAAVTKTVKLIPLVTPFTLRNPGHVAKMGMTIDVISGGRFILGVGTGWEELEHTSYGFPFDRSFANRYDRMIEGVEVVKKLWTEDQPVSYEGKYYQLKDAPFWPKPVQKPHPPIWFGGTGKKMREAVVRLGDGWYPAGMLHFGVTPLEYKQGWDEICEKAVSYGRDPRNIMPGLTFRVCIGETHEEALKLASIVRMRHDWEPYSIEHLIERCVVVAGTADEVAEGVNRFVEAGVRYLNFVPTPGEDFERQTELFVTRVIPQFSK